MRKSTYEELARLTAEQFADMDKLPVTVVLDNVRSLNNVGSFFRTCDAFAIGKIVLCGITATPPHRDIHKTALGAELTVNWEYCESAAEVVKALKDKGYTTVAVEQTDQSVMLGEYPVSDNNKYCLIFGNEVDGISDEVISLCDEAIEIPQAGTKHSLNVAVSGGIVLWHFFKNLI